VPDGAEQNGPFIQFEELYEICRGELGDLLKIRNAFLEWIESNPDQIDETL
jgi:hypothetical protein